MEKASLKEELITALMNFSYGKFDRKAATEAAEKHLPVLEEEGALAHKSIAGYAREIIVSS